MLGVGPLSSIFDFTTFAILLFVFHATELLFHTGWFVESLVTQTLVLLVIRTPRRPLQSRPSGALATTIALAVGILLPVSPLGTRLGLTPLPAAFLLYVAAATLAYLTVVELAKRTLLPLLLQ